MEFDSVAVQVYDIIKFMFDNRRVISTTKNMFDSVAVHVYDIRKFMFDNRRVISTTNNMFVVYLDGRRLYVLSVAPQGWVVWAANHFSDLHAFTFHKPINNYFRYPHVGLRYFEPLPIAAAAVGETGKKPPLITNLNIQTFQLLPDDYNSWSSTVILFHDNKDDEISVYALNSNDCLVYYVLSYRKPYVRPRGMGYTAGDFKLYFVGNAIFDDDLDDIPPQVSLHVDVYDIRTRQWITDDFPLMNSPKSEPFVFFLDGRLFVLSTQCSWYRDEPPFEMLDINNLSQGWVSLPKPEPSFAWNGSVVGSNHIKLIDYPEKMLYTRLNTDLLCGYSLHDNRWHTFDLCRGPFTGRMNNLYNEGRGCLKGSVIVEKYLYTFDVLEYPDGQRAILTILDLEHDIYPDPLSWEIDISSIVAPDVLLGLYAMGPLVYLGKSNSRLRFSVIIYYCKSYYSHYHLCTCTFDVRRIGEDSTISFLCDAICCCHYQHVQLKEPLYDCHKLSEVKE